MYFLISLQKVKNNYLLFRLSARFTMLHKYIICSYKLIILLRSSCLTWQVLRKYLGYFVMRQLLEMLLRYIDFENPKKLVSLMVKVKS